MSVMQSAVEKAVDRSRESGMNRLVDDLGRPTWMNGCDDPFVNLLVEPGNDEEAQEYARSFYRTGRTNRRKAALGIILTVGVTFTLWMLPLGVEGTWNRVALYTGVVLAAYLLIKQILTSSREGARAQRDAVQWQSWARSSLPLSSYLVTTNDPRHLWEAAGYQAMRDSVQKAIVSLHQYRVADFLTPSREEAVNVYLERDDELRAKIVELCDPTAEEVR